MLKEQLEKAKKHRVDLKTKVGGCRFCGQTRTLEAPPEWSDAFVDEAVTELCDCYEATRYVAKKKQKEKAERAIEKQFGQQAGKDEVEKEVVDMLMNILERVVEEQINSASVDIGKGVKAKISVTAKGFIKVERTRTEKTAQEA